MAEQLSIRDEWAQKHATEALVMTYDRHCRKPTGSYKMLVPLKPEELLIKAPPHLPVPEPKGDKKIAIIGAGAAGLFTALLLDFLNEDEELKKYFHVDYEIFESSDRVGGRLFTYNFSPNGKPNHHYYDVGAMRFPDNPIMKRTFQLFKFLGMDKYHEPVPKDMPVGSLRPYYITGDNEPWCFNNKNFTGSYPDIARQSPSHDPFKLSTDPVDPISQEALDIAAEKSPEEVLAHAIKPWVDELTKRTQEGWDALMKIDGMSTTEFLNHPPPPPFPKHIEPIPPPIPQKAYNYNTIEWLETFGGGTNWYDQAHSETVLEYLDFSYPKTEGYPWPIQWWCVEGGAQVLATKMLGKVKNKNAVHYKTRITGIDTSQIANSKIKHGGKWHGGYAAIFNSTTLGAMQQMDLRLAGLKYGQKQAIRSLGYGASAKVGMMFSEPWWRTKFGINRGGLGHSDIPTRTTVYPSYNVEDPVNEPAVLLCSYTWQQDAQRLSTLISSQSDPKKAKEEEAALKELVLWDLALLHTDHAKNPMTTEAVYNMIAPMCTDFHAHDWYHDPNTYGAFAFFRPLQFRSMWPYIIAPSTGLVIIGEHASNHHAWVVGALESAVFGMYSWLKLNQVPGADKALAKMEKLKDNLFGAVPKWLPKFTADWRAFLSAIEDENFRNEVKNQEGLAVRTK